MYGFTKLQRMIMGNPDQGWRRRYNAHGTEEWARGGPRSAPSPEAVEAYEAARAGRGTFPTEKVVGGVDLAGDDYDSSSSDPARSVPHPDDDPLDCGGHGTHVAGTAAGYGENADGTTFTGDYSALTPDALNSMRIGPGSAPAASLYAIRIFGKLGKPEKMTWIFDYWIDWDAKVTG